MGYPIQTSTAITVIGTLLWLFAANRVFLRLFYPRHPFLALKKLITFQKYNPVMLMI